MRKKIGVTGRGAGTRGRKRGEAVGIRKIYLNDTPLPPV